MEDIFINLFPELLNKEMLNYETKESLKTILGDRIYSEDIIRSYCVSNKKIKEKLEKLKKDINKFDCNYGYFIDKINEIEKELDL